VNTDKPSKRLKNVTVHEELVDLSEVGAAIKGVDVVGREGDGSGIGSQEGHVDVFTMVGVMS
jgi:hypothetical protein